MVRAFSSSKLLMISRRRGPKKGDALETDEFLSLLDAADQLDRERHHPATLEKGAGGSATA
jgi:hypothetical protein